MDTEWSEIIKNVVTTIAILIGGAWTIYRFGINRERHPKLQFDLLLNVLGKTEQHYIVELTATIENKGLTRLYIEDFIFHLLYFEWE